MRSRVSTHTVIKVLNMWKKQEMEDAVKRSNIPVNMKEKIIAEIWEE